MGWGVGGCAVATGFGGFPFSEFVVGGDYAFQLFFALDAFEFKVYFALLLCFCTFEAAVFAGGGFLFALELAFFALLVADEAAFLCFLVALFAGVARIGALDDAQEGCDLTVGLDDCGFGHVWE